MAVEETKPCEAPPMVHVQCYGFQQRIQSYQANASDDNALPCLYSPKGRENMEIWETFLESHKKCHHFEVFNDLPSTLITVQIFH